MLIQWLTMMVKPWNGIKLFHCLQVLSWTFFFFIFRRYFFFVGAWYQLWVSTRRRLSIRKTNFLWYSLPHKSIANRLSVGNTDKSLPWQFLFGLWLFQLYSSSYLLLYLWFYPIWLLFPLYTDYVCPLFLSRVIIHSTRHIATSADP